MRKILILAAAFALFCACHERPKEEDIVGPVAKSYYDQLIEGRYEEFVDGHYQADSIPASYREQLIANAQMFIAQQVKEHGGISRVQLVRSQTDTAKHAANVFLNFTYGDSTSEEVVVPMVFHRGIWLMR